MKKGSALLIVLGMLSFMLFSGLAFSIYMRQARLPSSFIRRTAMTRQLAKAALSEAMAEINDCIGNYPHPGVFDPGNNEDHRDASGKSGTYCYNTFYRRVFLGAGADKGLMENNPENALRRLLVNNLSDDPADATVSTLTLEGLAYLPPCLVNEARVYSRRTPTAKWNPFAFEAGRYAYTAIDVSDYFDINRVPASAHRSSASSTRITLAHAFEDGSHGGPGGSAAKVYYNQANSKQAQQYPFISLADWNLAMGSTKLGTYSSPVMDYIRRAESEPCAIVASDDETDQKVSAYRAMTFVTDSKFTEDASDRKDIEEEQYQPFERADMEKGSGKNLGMYLMREGGSNSAKNQVWDDHYLRLMTRLGMCELCDYLDEDSVPISLVIPTCEKVPMLCAMKPTVPDLTLKIERLGDATKELLGPNGQGQPVANPGAGVNTRTVSCWYLYQLDASGLNARGAQVSVMTLFPFLRNEDSGSFNVDGKVALFFTKSGEDVPLVFQQRTGTKLTMGLNPSSAYDDGIVNLAIAATKVDVPDDGGTDVERMKWKEDLRIADFATVANYLPRNTKASETPKEACIAKVLKQWVQTNNADPGDPPNWQPTQPPNNADIVQHMSKLKYVDRTGAQQDVWNVVENGGALELNVAFWLRVKDTGDSGKAVDLVPASGRDDTDQQISSAGSARGSAVYQRLHADGERLMKFKLKGADGSAGGISLAMKDMDENPSVTVTVPSDALVCPDPRYNHHPRNWMRVGGSDDVKAAWEANANFSGRAGDFLMSVSNQGYLQSIYELAFLPWSNRQTDELFGDLNTTIADWYDYPGNFGECYNSAHMWRTYTPYNSGGFNADDFDQLELTSGSGGQKVNPFTDSLAVLSSAFANTPLDWRAAGTNYQGEASIGTGYNLEKVDDFNKDYAWNEYNSEAKLPWFDGVMRLAKRFQGEMRTCSGIDEWEDVYGSLWDGNGTDPKRLMGVEIENGKFTSVDRKFFYGYWHDCFGVQQQLFLIFVRAEPMMMGGGVAGVAPPQLAARAVALVWRDPRPTEIDTETRRAKPHAMRVLFYHPLD